MGVWERKKSSHTPTLPYLHTLTGANLDRGIGFDALENRSLKLLCEILCFVPVAGRYQKLIRGKEGGAVAFRGEEPVFSTPALFAVSPHKDHHPTIISGARRPWLPAKVSESPSKSC